MEAGSKGGGQKGGQTEREGGEWKTGRKGAGEKGRQKGRKGGERKGVREREGKGGSIYLLGRCVMKYRCSRVSLTISAPMIHTCLG